MNVSEMKKLFTLVVLLAAMTFTAQAQVDFGLKAGLNLTKMKFSKDVINPDNRAGFFVGPTVKFTLPVVGLGIDASALYDQRSAEVGNTDFKQKSIQIPVNVRFGFGLGETANIFIFAGPQFGFNLGDKDLVTAAGNWTFKGSNLSGNVGLGLMLLNHLQISANYNFALSKTGDFTVTAIPQSMKENGKMNAWQIALAYYF